MSAAETIDIEVERLAGDMSAIVGAADYFIMLGASAAAGDDDGFADEVAQRLKGIDEILVDVVETAAAFAGDFRAGEVRGELFRTSVGGSGSIGINSVQFVKAVHSVVDFIVVRICGSGSGCASAGSGRSGSFAGIRDIEVIEPIVEGFADGGSEQVGGCFEYFAKFEYLDIIKFFPTEVKIREQVKFLTDEVDDVSDSACDDEAFSPAEPPGEGEHAEQQFSEFINDGAPFFLTGFIFEVDFRPEYGFDDERFNFQ